jgi:chaperonin cofactor prefoldin
MILSKGSNRFFLLLKSMHLFSATHAGLENWEEASNDAKECLRLNPAFLKGYYRLAMAQNELKEFETAIQTLQHGLAQSDGASDVAPLKKLLQIVQQKMKQKAAKSNTNNLASIPATSAVTLDEATQKELADLQEQQLRTAQELQSVEQQVVSAQRQVRISEVTESELLELPADRHCYKAVGKAFVMKWPSKEGAIAYLKEQAESGSKLQTDLGQKKEYLGRRLQNQRQNIQELISSASTAAASG